MNTYTFTPEQEAWLQALESEQYPQGKNALNRDGKYCCLGVACEVINKLRPNYLYLTSASNGRIEYNGSSGWLPSSAKALLNIETCNGLIFDPNNPSLKLKGYNSLAEANDNGVSFKEMADFIRKNPLAIFRA